MSEPRCQYSSASVSALSYTADVEIDKRHTLNVHEVVSVPAIEIFWASSKRRLRLFSISGILLSNISSKTVFWSCPSWRAFSTLSMFPSNSFKR